VAGELGEEVDDGGFGAGVVIVGEEGKGVFFTAAGVEESGVGADAGEVA